MAENLLNSAVWNTVVYKCPENYIFAMIRTPWSPSTTSSTYSMTSGSALGTTPTYMYKMMTALAIFTGTETSTGTTQVCTRYHLEKRRRHRCAGLTHIDRKSGAGSWTYSKTEHKQFKAATKTNKKTKKPRTYNTKTWLIKFVYIKGNIMVRLKIPDN